MTDVAPVRVRVDPTNPGQFFACCGLLELADRLWHGASGWFGGSDFLLSRTTETKPAPTLRNLLDQVAALQLEQVDEADDAESPIEVRGGFETLLLDWWKGYAGGRQLKVWAGSMMGVRIAKSMHHALGADSLDHSRLFDYATVTCYFDEPGKKIEPFYFDARRGNKALPLDIGFSPNALAQIKSLAYPSVEFFCLVGLQRFRPRPTDDRRIFEYYTWEEPLPPPLGSTAAGGVLTQFGGSGFRFQVGYRTDQKKHKAFTPATCIARR